MQAARAARKGVHRHFIKNSWISGTKQGSPVLRGAFPGEGEENRGGNLTLNNALDKLWLAMQTGLHKWKEARECRSMKK
jgi:hypothetical protein